MSDPINPDHYKSHPSGVEAITVTRHMGFNIGNAMKYLWRAGLKADNSAIQDLKKAIWYLEDEIERLDGGKKEFRERLKAASAPFYPDRNGH